MKLEIESMIAVNGTGLHKDHIVFQVREDYYGNDEIVIRVGPGVSEIKTKKDALKLAAFCIQAAKRLSK